MAPWTPDEMKAKGAKRPDVAANVANRVYKACLKAGGTDKTCAPKAIIRGLGVSNRGQSNG